MRVAIVGSVRAFSDQEHPSPEGYYNTNRLYGSFTVVSLQDKRTHVKLRFEIMIEGSFNALKIFNDNATLYDDLVGIEGTLNESEQAVLAAFILANDQVWDSINGIPNGSRAPIP